MIELIVFAAATAAIWVTHGLARRFVRERLRFVDAAQKPFVPWLAGVAVATVALPVTGLLPFVGVGTAIVLGLSVGLGVARGAADIRRRDGGDWTSLPRL